MEKHLFSKGQSLLVLVLLIALILSVVSATSYRLTLETRSTKIQEESIRALAAADNGIEVGMQKAATTAIDDFETYSFEQLSIVQDGINSQDSKVLISRTSTSEFVTPLIPKDSQYTFYFKDPANPNAASYDAYTAMYIRAESGSNCAAPRTMPAFEVTYLYDDNTVRRNVYEPCPAGTDVVRGTVTSFSPPTSETYGGYVFTQAVLVTAPYLYPPENLRAIVVRSLFGASRLAFTGVGLPSQGKDIRSEAYTRDGASKIVTVFQSFPQIPSEFFVTTF